MTPAPPLDLELFVLAVDPVWFFVLPLISVARPSLELMAVVSIDVFGSHAIIVLLVFLGWHC
jgi:hypothetical protein